MTLKVATLLGAALLLAAGSAKGQLFCDAGAPPCRSPNCNRCAYGAPGTESPRLFCAYEHEDASCGCGWDSSYTVCWNVGICDYVWWGNCDERWRDTRTQPGGPRRAAACWPWEPRRAAGPIPVPARKLAPSPERTVLTGG